VPSDAELIQQVRAGNTDAFASLVGRYERSVRGVAFAALGDHHSAEDATQEAFVSAFRSLESLRDAAKFGPWLMQIARRTAAWSVRQRPLPTVVATSNAIEATHEPIADERRHVLQLVDRLPEQERLAISMHYFDGHSAADIGAATGRSVGTVTKQLSRAYKRLRAWYSEDDR